MDSQESRDIKSVLVAGLALHTGSTCWFRHWTGRLVYTEGVQFLAEKASAYWLIDLVASWCPHPSLRDEDFVFWKVGVNPDRSATAIADDGNSRELARQEIPWTDFPLDEISLYLTDNTLLPTIRPIRGTNYVLTGDPGCALANGENVTVAPSQR